MTDGNTLIVDVVSSGDDYMLNDTPVNMMIAYEVVRRHVTDNGTFYSQMTMKQKTAEGYVFKFDTGDEFTCTSDTAYPTAESVSDETGGGSGGGVLVVHLDTESGALDKTWSEIDAADVAVIVFSGSEGGETFHVREFVNNTSAYDGDYFVNALVEGGGGSSYIVSGPDDYPVRQ